MTVLNPTDPPVEAPCGSLPPLLARALTAEPPGDMLPPGPRMNPWPRVGARPVPLTGRLGDLLLGLWGPIGVHRRADGTPTSIPRRPVPSAGGTHAVHTHVVVGPQGCEDLAPGLYVYDHERSLLLQRDRRCEPIPPWPETLPPEDALTLVLTVHPGRSFGRYRHRAWPLWIADAAYAQQAVEFLLATRLPAMTGPSHRLRRLLGVPAAGSAERWLPFGLVPEIPLVALNLPPAAEVDRRRRRALAARRSPEVEAFTGTGPRNAEARWLAAASGQHWVQYADRVETWSIPVRSPAPHVASALWQAHRAAATACYAATLSGRWRIRPVSGIPAAHGDWTMHALAMLETPPLRTERTMPRDDRA